MTGEVISLISSPSVGPTPLSQAVPRRTTTPGLLSDDVFDLTGASPIATASHRNGSVSASNELPPAKQSNPHPPNNLFFLSDDFDTTGDLDKSLDVDWVDTPHQTGSNKRRRLSPSTGTQKAPFGRSQSAIIASSHSSIQRTKGLHRAQTLADPIEFSSSPFGPPSAQPRRVNTDDPFASTPIQPPAVTEQRIPPSSIDPFASDPPSAPLPTIKPTSKPTNAPVIEIDDDDLDTDPFASSPKAPPPRTSTKPTKPTAPASRPKTAAAWDPISSSAPELNGRPESFSSSPPIYRSKKPPPARREPAVISLSDSEASPRTARHVDCFDDEEFPDLADIDMSKYRTKRRTSPLLDLSPSRRNVSRPTSKTSASAATKQLSAAEKTRAREAKAADREAEKERKRLEKEAAKEQKAKEKERAAALADVNKVRTDKKVSTPEMIVDLPDSLPPAMALQAQELLKDLDVEFSTWHSPMDNVVKWRRKVRSRFNDDLGMWEPTPLQVENESYALVAIVAAEFVSMTLGEEGKDLDAHVTRMKSSFPGLQLIYLVEGLTPWMRKNRSVRNRQFVSAVRGQEAEGANAPTSTARRRKNQAPQEYIDEDMVEDALLQLQVVHGVQIHHTAAPIETAQWIAVFTQHISTVPYRKQKEAANAAGAGFCMESGQVRTGEDVKDTYTKLLQEIVRVTAPIAYGIATEFESVTALVKGLEEGGPLALEGCRKSSNKDGGLSDRAVGQAVSRRIHKVFTGRDETSTDV